MTQHRSAESEGMTAAFEVCADDGRDFALGHEVRDDPPLELEVSREEAGYAARPE